jgi:hypothetical protein
MVLAKWNEQLQIIELTIYNSEKEKFEKEEIVHVDLEYKEIKRCFECPASLITIHWNIAKVIYGETIRKTEAIIEFDDSAKDKEWILPKST